MSSAVLRVEGVVALTQEGVPREIAEMILKDAISYNVIQERWCNEDMDDGTRTRVEAREARIERRITDLLAPYGIAVEFGGDPRGYTVKVSLPSGKSNSFTGEGWGLA